MLFENHIQAFENDVHWKEKNKLIQINHWKIFWVLFYLGVLFISVKLKVLVAQSYPTLSDPMDCTLPGSSVPGILQTRILEWVAIPFSKGSSRPRDGTQVSCIAGKFFTVWATREALLCSEELSIQKRRIVENRTRIRGIAYGNRGMHKCDGSKVEMTHSFQGVRES